MIFYLTTGERSGEKSVALYTKPFSLDISVPWQLIYWSPKPSIKPFSCADWPASLQRRQKKKKKINLKPGSLLAFD